MKSVIRDGRSTPPVSISDVPEPRPADDEAVVGLSASTINRGELSLLDRRPDGWKPGQDLAGVVVRAAADGSGPPEGTRVVGMVDGAAWAERVAARTSRLAILPEDVSFEEAAALGMSGLTALRALRLAGAVVGRDVLVTGATGGVGHLAAQLAGIAGARVAADDIREGAFDIVLDGVGSRTLRSAVHALRRNGTVVLYGASDPEPASLTLLDFIGHEGGRILTYLSYSVEEDDAADLATLAALVGDGRLKPAIAATYTLERAGEAVAVLARRGVRGKIVLTP